MGVRRQELRNGGKRQSRDAGLSGSKIFNSVGKDYGTLTEWKYKAKTKM